MNCYQPCVNSGTPFSGASLPDLGSLLSHRSELNPRLSGTSGLPSSQVCCPANTWPPQYWSLSLQVSVTAMLLSSPFSVLWVGNCLLAVSSGTYRDCFICFTLLRNYVLCCLIVQYLKNSSCFIYSVQFSIRPGIHDKCDVSAKALTILTI